MELTSKYSLRLGLTGLIIRGLTDREFDTLLSTNNEIWWFKVPLVNTSLSIKCLKVGKVTYL